MTTIAKMKKNKNKTIPQNGSVLILALIMASILLSVGMGISNIALKEIKLSSLGNESGIAFYTADTGAECALYWDLKNPYGPADIVFGTPDVAPTYPPGPSHACAGIDISVTTGPGGPGDYYWNQSTPNANTYITIFAFPQSVGSRNTCALVAVTKTKDPVSLIITTKIDSRGRSLDCDAIDPRAVERGIQVSY